MFQRASIEWWDAVMIFLTMLGRVGDGDEGMSSLGWFL
jgi:hypothetical protein